MVYLENFEQLLLHVYFEWKGLVNDQILLTNC